MSDCTTSIPSPNCPYGYVWGGLACRRAEEPQTCSEGYFWDGTKCVEGTDVVCAPGYFLSAGVCMECEVPVAPTLTPTAGNMAVSFTVAFGSPYNIFKSVDGVTYTYLSSGTGAGFDTFNDTDVIPDVTYYYYLSIYVSAECGFIDGAVASIAAM